MLFFSDTWIFQLELNLCWIKEPIKYNYNLECLAIMPFVSIVPPDKILEL